VVADEDADPGHRDEDADVEECPEFPADGNQLTARDSKKRRRPDIRQDALLAQADYGGFDFGVDRESLAGVSPDSLILGSVLIL
jgi:hypothetical protein